MINSSVFRIEFLSGTDFIKLSGPETRVQLYFDGVGKDKSKVLQVSSIMTKQANGSLAGSLE